MLETKVRIMGPREKIDMRRVTKIMQISMSHTNEGQWAAGEDQYRKSSENKQNK